MDHDRKTALLTGSSWIGVVLVALGVCGFLDAAGIVDSSQTIGQWWPLVIVAWAAIDMLKAGRITAWGIGWSAVGVALLADAQQWASDVVIWSALAVFVGALMLAGALGRLHKANGDHSDASTWNEWARYCGWTR